MEQSKSRKGHKHSNKSILKVIDEYDKLWSEKIHSLELSDLAELVMYISARLFNPDFVALYFILLTIYYGFFHGNYSLVIKPLIQVIVTLLVTLFTKHLIGRPRPILNENVKRNWNLRHKETNCSMPSGDAMQSANFAVILFCYFDTWLGFLLIPFVMVSRVFYSCHFICDTIVGAIMGIFLSYLLYLFLRNI